MDAKRKRREEDVRKLQTLCVRFAGVTEILPPRDPSLAVIKMRLGLPTALDSTYPKAVQEQTDIKIELSQDYPFREPRVTILTPIWNPNVYPNTVVCLGTKWLPTQGLDLLVERLMQLIVFDPLIVNTASPANSEAAQWYLAARRRNPGLFPTIDLEKLRKPEPGRGIKFKPFMETPEIKVIVECPLCHVKLRAVKGRVLRGRCRNCNGLIELKT